MDTDSSMVIVLVVLIALSAVFSSAETAFLSTNKIRLRNLQEDGEKKAGLVLDLLENQNRLISTLLVGNNIVNISASALATKMATDYFGDAGVGIATGIMTLLVLVFGEVIPKNLAAAHAEGWAMFVAPFIKLVSVVLTPLVFLLTKLSDTVVRFSKKNEEEDPTITEDEFKILVNVGQEEGVFDESETEMINSIMEFDETYVKAIMVPRIDIVAVDVDDSINDALRLIIDGGHSRIPAYEESIDNIVGILYAKDIFEHLNANFDELKVRELIRDAYYIPETKKVSDLLNELRLKKVHMAIILDEYGGTNGLVTIEDLIEEIIGDIQDEYDVEEDLIVMHSDNQLVADARAPIGDVEEAFDVELDEEILEESEADTIGGLAFEHLGGIPEVGDEVTVGRFLIRIVNVSGRRITKVEVTLLPPEEDEDDEDEE
ncbi:MAG: HlyC/CorC family transporter [Peptococcaceae bacterium]|nr:HlyC/CorC family transporter [Peptococcaceae bacterium]MBQ5683918.1 HlyC/CorC family transporter [Peptococcaceae bacterium]MBQ5702887.1 HlyC/CorC family transporter [Peptococcaceae bacterium]MBQ5857980.1 HlyC/CorC family transporter [Peptococcaceae bacterium]